MFILLDTHFVYLGLSQSNIMEWNINGYHVALRRKSKDWLARNQNNVSEWSDMSTRGI